MTQVRNYLSLFNNDAKKEGALISPNKIWAFQTRRKGMTSREAAGSVLSRSCHGD